MNAMSKDDIDDFTIYEIKRDDPTIQVEKRTNGIFIKIGDTWHGLQ